MIEVKLMNASVTWPSHLLHKRPTQQEHSGKIRVHHSPPLVEREVGYDYSDVDAGIVDEDLNIAKLLSNLFGQMFDLILVGHVRGNHYGLSSKVAINDRCLLQLANIA